MNFRVEGLRFRVFGSNEVQASYEKECRSSTNGITSISKLQKKCLAIGEGLIFGVPALRDLDSGISVSVSAAWRPGFGYVLAAVSVTVPAGSRYESGKQVPVTSRMVTVTPRGYRYTPHHVAFI